MIQFDNACRKGCPWLVRPTKDTEDFIEPECTAFNEILERDEDPESEGLFKCDECKKITSADKVKDASIDSLAHSLAVMTNRLAHVTKHVNTLQASVKEATEAFKTLGSAMHKAKLSELISNDPNS